MSTSRTREKADGELFKSTGIDDNATSTAVTIDASENVLVGKTATAFGTAGTVLRGDNAGLLQSTRAGVSLELNRISSDGNIIDLAKDGTTVGSIGSSSGKLKVSSVNTGLIFGDAFDEIYPLTNGVTTLGDAGAKFKDLYLSGGVYLGGTGAANKLDDYEEGTWTPTFGGGMTITYPSTTARYTKVGTLVTWNCS